MINFVNTGLIFDWLSQIINEIRLIWVLISFLPQRLGFQQMISILTLRLPFYFYFAGLKGTSCLWSFASVSLIARSSPVLDNFYSSTLALQGVSRCVLLFVPSSPANIGNEVPLPLVLVVLFPTVYFCTAGGFAFFWAPNFGDSILISLASPDCGASSFLGCTSSALADDGESYLFRSSPSSSLSSSLLT